jgi:ABC-type Fe3+ transport system substrate-binding protein
MQALDEGDILQKNIYAENESKLTEKFISKNKSYLGLGYDPYVIVALQDTSKRIKAYSDLAKEVSFGTNLSGKNEIFPFYAAIVSKTKKDSKFTLPQWLNQFVENKKTQHDSIVSIPTNLLFTTYSYVLNEKFKKSRFKDGTIVFPNQRKGGSYYNMCTFGIIKQARNYHNAQLLKSYLLHESVNKQFNYHIKMFPVISSKESLFKYQNTRFKKNSHSPIQESSDYFNMQKLLAHLF